MIPADVEALALADIAGALDPDEQRELQVRLAALPPDVREQREEPRAGSAPLP